MADEIDPFDDLARFEELNREAERVARLREQHDFGALRKRLLREFRVQVVPMLRELGFAGSVPHFHRQRGDSADLVMLQIDRYGGGFMLNLGRGDPALPADVQRFAQLEWDRRARLTRDPSGRTQEWFRYDGPAGTPEEQQDRAIAEVREWLPHADAWFKEGVAVPHVSG